jgi:hypothetical protein
MPKKPATIEEGDHVILHAKVTKKLDPVSGMVVVRIDGYDKAPITIGSQWVEVVEKGKEPKVRDLGV